MASRALRPKNQGTYSAVSGSQTERSRNGVPRGKSNNAPRTIGSGTPVASVPVGGVAAGGGGGGVAKFKIKTGGVRGGGGGGGGAGAAAGGGGWSGYDVLSSEVNEGDSSSSA